MPAALAPAGQAALRARFKLNILRQMNQLKQERSALRARAAVITRQLKSLQKRRSRVLAVASQCSMEELVALLQEGDHAAGGPDAPGDGDLPSFRANL